MVIDAVRDELVDPVMLARRGSADAVTFAHGLDRARGGIVDFEIVIHRAGKEDPEIRLVPDLAEPAFHFLAAVARLPVGDGGMDESIIFVIIARRRDVALPPEDGPLARGHGVGREDQLNEGADALRKHLVEDLVDILPVVDELPFPAADDGHVVAEQAVKAEITEAAFGDSRFHLVDEARAKRFMGAARADAEIGKAVKGAAFGVQSDLDPAHIGALLSR